MKKKMLAIICVLFGLAIFSLRHGIETNIYALVGCDGVLSTLADKTSQTIRVFCQTSEAAKKCREVFSFSAPFEAESFMETVRLHSRGLLTAKSREALIANDLERINRSVMRRDYSGVGLFSKEEDPYYFLTDFVMAISSLRPKEFVDGAEILVTSADPNDKATAEGLRKLIALAKSDDAIYLSGAPFHTLISTDETKLQINIIGVLSVAVVLFLGWMLFRSFEFVLPTAFALLAGFLVGTITVGLLSFKPHAMTFLFGTTLIGVGVDYCYHAIANGNTRALAARLSHALITTCLAFAPLLCSSVAVLREMSVFTISGLVTIYLFARFYLVKIDLHVHPQPSFIRKFGANIWTRRVFFVLFLLLVGYSLFRGIEFSTDPSRLYMPKNVMAKGEAKFADMTGEGEVVLVPLKPWQRENARLKEKLAPVSGEFLTAHDLPAWLTLTKDGEEFLMLPKKAADVIIGNNLFATGASKLHPKATLNELFASIEKETYFLLVTSVGVFALVAAFFFHSRMIVMISPVCGAVATTLLLVSSTPITVFQILSLFILIGLGIDYTIFHRSHSYSTAVSSVVFYSFLTSFFAFGFLSFTTFPVTQSMGFTLAIGLFFAYIFSLPRAKK